MNLRTASLLILPLALASAVAAADDRFRPATFGTGATSIVNVVACPEQRFEQALVWVFCQGEVRDTGEVRQPHCIADGPYREFRAAALDAFRGAQFEPARVDGSPVSVYLSFRLAFQLQGEHCAVTAIPNKGFHVAELGLAYVEPQEIVPDRGWQPRRMNTPGTRANRSGTAFTISVHVDERGSASDSKVEQLSIGGRREASTAARAMAGARFVPGFVDGRPRAMRGYEYFYLEADALDVRGTSIETPSGPASRGVP
jgi:hypothetical protein